MEGVHRPDDPIACRSFLRALDGSDVFASSRFEIDVIGIGERGSSWRNHIKHEGRTIVHGEADGSQEFSGSLSDGFSGHGAEVCPFAGFVRWDGDSFHTLRDRREEVDCRCHFARPCEIDAGDRPEGDDGEGPEADDVVRIEVDSLPAFAEVHDEASGPGFEPGPPENETGECEDQEQRSSDAVQNESRRSTEEKEVVELTDPTND